MKKTTKTLLSLLLVLVMALQFGVMVPIARADDLPGSAAVDLFVLAPVDNDGNLSTSAQTNGQLKDESILSALATLTNVSALQSDGVVLTPPDGYAVASLYIAAAPDDDLFEAVDTSFASLTGTGAQIQIDSSFFSDSKFDSTSTEYKLYLVLCSVTAVAAEDATCTEPGHDAYYMIGNELYLIDAIPETDPAIGHHSDPLEHHESTATCGQAGTGEYWECTVCHQLFSNAAGTTQIDSAPSAAATGNHDLQHHPAVTATAETPDGNIEYWECGVCGKYFSDEGGTTEIEDHDSVITHYQAPAATTCTLSFDPGDGTGDMDPMTVTVGEEYIVPACAFNAPENKEFSHWLRGDLVLHPNDNDTINGDNTLVAVWKDIEAPAHTHSLTLVPARNATAAADGNKAYYACSGCSEIFLDAEGQQPTTLAAVTILASETPAVIQEGTETSWEPKDTDGLSLHFDADFATNSAGLTASADGNLIDAQYVKVTQGSVIVTIDPAYLTTLGPGTHTITVHFPSGHDVAVTVTITGASSLALAIDATGFTKVYDGKSFDLESLKSYITVINLPTGYKAGVSIDFESAITEFHTVGTTTLKLTLTSVKNASDVDVTSSFTCDPLTGVALTITKRKIGAETRDDSMVYDGLAWKVPSHTGSSFNPQPIMTYTDPKLGEYVRDGKTYVQTISIKYTAAPKNMGTYENAAELIIREKEKGSADPGVDVTSNYEITYKFGKIKITDASGKIPTGTTPVTGDTNNIWVWVGLMAAAVVIVVVLLVVMRKGKKGDEAPSSGASE